MVPRIHSPTLLRLTVVFVRLALQLRLGSGLGSQLWGSRFGLSMGWVTGQIQQRTEWMEPANLLLHSDTGKLVFSTFKQVDPQKSHQQQWAAVQQVEETFRAQTMSNNDKREKKSIQELCSSISRYGPRTGRLGKIKIYQAKPLFFFFFYPT